VIDPARSYSIGEVSRLLALPTPTIRSWERRHDLRLGTRTPAGHRRYHADDIGVLTRLRDELAGGRSAGEAARIALSTLTVTPATLVDRFCTGARAFDTLEITETLDQARTLLGLTATVEEVAFPAMRELGRRWAATEGDVAHEHVATAALQAWLQTVRRTAPAPAAQAPVLLACGPDEQHTLALDALAALLAHAGVRCLELGARVPAASLEEAVRVSRARAVVLTCQIDSNRHSTVAALRAVAGTSADLYYAGAAFSSPCSRHGVPGHHLGDSISLAVRRLTPDERSAAGSSTATS